MISLGACVEKGRGLTMPARFSFLKLLVRAASFSIIVTFLPIVLWAQKPTQEPPAPLQTNSLGNSGTTDVDVRVRASRGDPLSLPALVRLYSMTTGYNTTTSTLGASGAHFYGVLSGNYELEVTCAGYNKTTEHLSLAGSSVPILVDIYIEPKSGGTHIAEPPRGVVMTPQLRSQVLKGLQALDKKQFETARGILSKASQKAPGNPDIIYFLGIAELGLLHVDLARDDFQRAFALNPKHQLALVSLGELQLRNSAPADAIVYLEKAVALGTVTWHVHFELAFAYAKLNRLTEAEAEASRAILLAKERGALATFLLAQIQLAQGKREDARRSRQTLLANFPSDPIVSQTKKMLARSENDTQEANTFTNGSLPLSPAPNSILEMIIERPWAPPDIDGATYDPLPDANCATGAILEAAFNRIKSELVDFEKFTATEHIEHQEIDRYGFSGAVKARNFSYVVSVHHLGADAFYLEESRLGGNDVSAFPTSLASVGLIGLGLSVLQPVTRAHFRYSCEGLTTLRGQTAWQLRFEQRRDIKAGDVRVWRRNGEIYDIPLKGRIWISNNTFAVIRVETDLREPISKLELSRDHLLVDYGPVNFSSGNIHLWLPLCVDVYLVLHGRRYHHRHFLSDYLLFSVDTTHAIGRPKELPLPPL
jgi:Flp pilus assembly protein TadD